MFEQHTLLALEDLHCPFESSLASMVIDHVDHCLVLLLCFARATAL